MGVRATVHNGRLVVDEETQLPESTVLDLVIDDEGDDLDEAQRRTLDAAICESLKQAKRGELAPADDILGRLRARRHQGRSAYLRDRRLVAREPGQGP